LFTKHFLSKETPIKEPLSVEDYQRLNNYVCDLKKEKYLKKPQTDEFMYSTYQKHIIQSEIESVEGELKMWN
ncbi:hypothetical protein ABFV51_27950, partial [Pseudomonas asgharzadehiana]|uniref:hypothetical protein n=1 Tax=Pseudomonas asgharzadehiana TaxID=2842349 RepID=UPI0034D39D65